MTPRPLGWPWRKPRPSRPNVTPAPPPGPPAPRPPKPKTKEASAMFGRIRESFWLDFVSVVTNLCWPTIALFALIVATQAESLNY